MLDALFDSARRKSAMPDAEFLALLSRDMEASVPAVTSAPAGKRGAGFLSRFRGAFAASGLTGAAALGVWIGFVMPEVLNDLADFREVSDGFAIGTFLPSADLAALSE